jgi:hypothetical protein
MIRIAPSSVPIQGFEVRFILKVDDITDIMAYGKALRGAEDGGGDQIAMPEEALGEVGWTIAAAGVKELIRRGGVYVEIDQVEAAALGEQAADNLPT